MASPTFTIRGLEPECPVCFESFVEPLGRSPRIYECNDGHPICQKCVEQVNICPQCREPMPVDKRRSYAVERLISEGKFVCSHTIAGCGGEFLTKEELDAHEEVCILKEITTARPLLILDLERRVLKDGFDREAINSVLDKAGDRPIVVFCVSGPAREGKSYFLNQCLEFVKARNVATRRPPSEYSGFLSRGGRKPVTLGIQLWSEPLIQRTPQGEVAVLLIDTQGLADMQTNGHHKAMLFTFSWCLASVMIHNQASPLNKLMDENALVEFDCYSNLAQGVVDSFNRERVAGSKDIALASKLLFLRRDFRTADTDDYALGLHSENEKPVGSERNYYQDLFHDSSTGSEQRDLLENIQMHFPHISAYLLPSPGEEFPKTDPTARFTQHMKTLVKMLMSENYLAQAKKTTTERLLLSENSQAQEEIITVSGTQFKEIVERLEELFRSRDKYFVQAKDREELQDSVLLMTLINCEREAWEHEADAFLDAHKEGASDDVLKEFANRFTTGVIAVVDNLQEGPGLRGRFLKQWKEFFEGWYANLKKRNELVLLETQINSVRETWTQEANSLLDAHTEGASDEDLQKFANKFSTRFKAVINKFKNLGSGTRDEFMKKSTEFCDDGYAHLKERNEGLKKTSLLKKIGKGVGIAMGVGVALGALVSGTALVALPAAVVVGSEVTVAAGAAGGGFGLGATLTGIVIAVKDKFKNLGKQSKNEETDLQMDAVIEDEEDEPNAAEDEPFVKTS